MDENEEASVVAEYNQNPTLADCFYAQEQVVERRNDLARKIKDCKVRAQITSSLNTGNTKPYEDYYRTENPSRVNLKLKTAIAKANKIPTGNKEQGGLGPTGEEKKSLDDEVLVIQKY